MSPGEGEHGWIWRRGAEWRKVGQGPTVGNCGLYLTSGLMLRAIGSYRGSVSRGQDRAWSEEGWQGGGLEGGGHWELEIWGRGRLRSRQYRKGDYLATEAEVREEVRVISKS